MTVAVLTASVPSGGLIELPPAEVSLDISSVLSLYWHVILKVIQTSLFMFVRLLRKFDCVLHFSEQLAR